MRYAKSGMVNRDFFFILLPIPKSTISPWSLFVVQNFQLIPTDTSNYNLHGIKCNPNTSKNLSLPQTSLPSLIKIGVSLHLNYPRFPRFPSKLHWLYLLIKKNCIFSFKCLYIDNEIILLRWTYGCIIDEKASFFFYMLFYVFSFDSPVSSVYIQSEG